MTVALGTTQVSRRSPYKGLRPFTEADASIFFGRKSERDVIIANLEARKLILLYGPSGVGKSSLLRAGVAARLRELAEQDREALGTPEFIPVVFSHWRDDPLRGLLTAVEESVAEVTGDTFQSDGSLVQLIEDVTGTTHSSLLIILDQFEDFSFYYADEKRAATFEEEFVAAVNQPGLPVGFLLSIREDALATLDRRFRRKIPTLFDYSLSINPLDATAASEAIRGPIEQYNGERRRELEGEGAGAGPEKNYLPVTVDEDLVKAVLEQVQVGRVVLDREGRGTVNGAAIEADKPGFVEASYLQLVMKRVWDEEMELASRVLRLSTLRRLGDAETIIKTHLDTALKGLTTRERDVAADVLRFLVTPSGTKIALDVDALVDFSERPKKEVSAVLDKLASGEIRVLRRQSDEEPPRYEIFHDKLAAAVLDWRLRHLEERRVRRLRVGAVVAALSTAAVVAAVFVFLVLPGETSKPGPPAAYVAKPRQAANYTQNQLVRAEYFCNSPSKTRMISCRGSVPPRSPLDTGTIGVKVFQVTVTVRRSNGTMRTISYEIPYTVVPATFDHGEFRAATPAKWLTVENGTSYSGFTETKWVDPQDKNDEQLVDVSPARGLSPLEDANSVRAGTERSAGYREVSFGKGTLGQGQSAEWIFRLPGSVRVDYFFSKCGHDFAVLGSTSPAHFAELLPVFDGVARSVQAVCRQ